MRRRLLVAAVAAALTAGCGDDGPGPRGVESADSLADEVWSDRALAAGDLDTCGAVAVMSDGERDLRVVLVEDDRVVVPAVAPPDDSEVVIDRGWLTTGGCVPTADGPVVVVEAQEAGANLYDDAPQVVAGFTPEGEQLWSVELAGDLAGSYDGRGSVVFESLDDDTWLVVDARTGATVASGGAADGAPVTALGPSLVDDLTGGLVDLRTGREYGGAGDSTAQVDDDRMLLQTAAGVRLVRLPGLGTIWRAGEDVRLTGIWTEAADLATGTVVAFATSGEIVGLDLATGRQKWSSDVAREEVNGLETQVGSGVVVFRRNGQDPLGQVVLDSATGEELTGADGFVVADQALLLEVSGGAVTPVTVADLR